MDLKEKTTNELITSLYNLKLEHAAIKNKLLEHFDKLVEVEDEYIKINKILEERTGHDIK